MIGTYQTSLIFIKIGYMNLHILSLFGFINIFLFAGPEHGSWGRNREETWNFIINFYLVYVYIYITYVTFPNQTPPRKTIPESSLWNSHWFISRIFLLYFHDIPISWTFVITHEISQRFSQFLGENHQALTSIGFHRGHASDQRSWRRWLRRIGQRLYKSWVVFWHLNYHSYRELWYVMMLVL